jgi:hypothetical protein
MRKTWIVFGAVRGILANPLPDDLQQTPPPKGVGTGVTIAIAPPGGSPPGCLTTYKGDFAIAAINMTSLKQFFDKDLLGSGASDGASAIGDSLGSMGDNSMGGMSDIGANSAVKESSAAPKVTGLARLIDVAKAVPDPEVTVTVRSTRTSTVTVKSAKASVKPAVSSVDASPTSGSDYAAGGKVKAAVLYQIGDGQVQAPTKATPIPLPTTKPTSGPFAPLPASAPRVSQIGDGQIQAPVGGGKPAAAKPAGASPNSPKSPSSGSAPAPAAAAPAAAGGHAGMDMGPAPAAAQAPAAAGGHAGMDMSSHNMVKRATSYCNAASKPVRMTLKDGVLKDQNGRTGYIADNRQFQ